MKRRLLWICVPVFLFPLATAGQDVKMKVEKETISGPEAGSDRAAWLAQMGRWRDKARARIKYDGAEYARKELLWTQRSFVQPQMMVEERYFYDVTTGTYTVDRYLDDLDKRYGGIDAVLVWPVYPNIGIDNRNQHDLLHDMPGGLAGVKQVVSDFHRRGVKVFFPVMPWDTGTRDEGVPLWEAAVRDMKAIGADGINGDTMSGLPREYREASDRTGHVLAFEPEVGLSDDAMLMWNNLTWGYWKYQTVPVVSKYKWLDPRHMVNVCERWAKNRTDGLQSAFFNGVGYESWENVWGIWNQLTPRDAEALRRMAAIERAVADLLVSADWEPHVPTLQAGVCASRFPHRKQTVWLLVNREARDTKGDQLKVSSKAGTRYYDLWAGTELQPKIEGDAATLTFAIEGRGFGAVLATGEGKASPEIAALLTKMASLAKARLDSFSQRWTVLPQKIVEISPTKPAKKAPEGMVLIPGAKYRFNVSGVEIEGGEDPGVDVQYPWEDQPQRHHDKELAIGAFYIDRHPVTNAEFRQFTDSAGYKPKDGHNFLRDWKNGMYPSGWAKKPVTWVSIEDARAYAAWAGKRLPHEWEWQYAAQGTDGRAYPWGNDPDETAVPKFEEGRDLRPPTAVDAFPKGASAFGVLDLTGNVWQWTDEYRDEHTRAGIVRGGSYYRPKGSRWYFPRNTKLGEHGKYLLMAPSKDRSALVGFRCVVDAE